MYLKPSDSLFKFKLKKLACFWRTKGTPLGDSQGKTVKTQTVKYEDIKVAVNKYLNKKTGSAIQDC